MFITYQCEVTTSPRPVHRNICMRLARYKRRNEIMKYLGTVYKFVLRFLETLYRSYHWIIFVCWCQVVRRACPKQELSMCSFEKRHDAPASVRLHDVEAASLN